MCRLVSSTFFIALLHLLGCVPDVETAPSTRAVVGDTLYVLYGKPRPTADDPELFSNRAPIPTARPPGSTVVLAVLDTVRADHLSACGYFRPTSPTLEALVRRGAQLTCRAYAPADWTLPSHASFFTGRTPLEHGAGWASERRSREGVVETNGLSIHPLGPELPTLAEQMAQRGYQTVLVSANRLLTGATGLSRGFERAVAPPESSVPHRPWVEALLARELREHVDPSKPLFLVLNILDAHDPWIAPPPTLDWPDPPRETMPPASFAEAFSAYPSGQLDQVSIEPFRRQLVDLYDYGVLRADEQLGRALEQLEKAGWLEEGARVVVTADHGENLVEHGLVRHSLLYEGNVRVPLLHWRVGDGPAPRLPEPVSAIVVYSLVLDGELPGTLPVVQSISVPSLSHFRTREASAPAMAMWKDHEKILLSADTWRRFDLRHDPGEQQPLPVHDDDPRRRALLQVNAALESSARPLPEASGQLFEQLKALGYVQ